jgi:hypothetical protein
VKVTPLWDVTPIESDMHVETFQSNILPQSSDHTLVACPKEDNVSHRDSNFQTR